MKNVIYAMSIGATFLVGCGHPADADHSADLSETTSQELTAVQNCIALGKECSAGATTPTDADVCAQKVRACLTALVPDAGAVTPPVIPDAAVPPFDAAVPPVNILDAATPPVNVPDAGSTPTAVQACLTALGACLSSATDPVTCAERARSCIQKAL